MKRVLLLLVSIIFAVNVFAEEVSPIRNVEVLRKVWCIDIEGTNYYNCIVTVKANEPDYVFTQPSVKVTVKNSEGNKIFKKKFKNSNLYIFSNGQIQIGRPNFDKVVIFKEHGDSYRGKIREKEGVYEE